MKISYAITVHDEMVEFERLFALLVQHKRDEDEIVVLVDSTGISPDEVILTPELEEGVKSLVSDLTDNISFHHHDLNNDFATHKNYLNSKCTGDYIFQIDADEMPHPNLIESLPGILEANLNLDLIQVPRVNTVKGITPEHIKKWGWRVDKQGRINWPDSQDRIYKNSPDVKWEGRVHERIKGVNTYTSFPINEEYALYHPKTIDKQEKQNKFYEGL